MADETRRDIQPVPPTSPVVLWTTNATRQQRTCGPSAPTEEPPSVAQKTDDRVAEPYEDERDRQDLQREDVEAVRVSEKQRNH
jgi:hypothetical protein